MDGYALKIELVASNLVLWPRVLAFKQWPYYGKPGNVEVKIQHIYDVD